MKDSNQSRKTFQGYLNEIEREEISYPEALKTMPAVSVHMLTYNHERYIAQAIEGVLLQKTDFPVELVIGEDCSTDRTREIVMTYQHKYPHFIRIITSKKNVGMKKNGLRNRSACRGQYIAWCEGDDYWTDPLKLQKQFDILNRNPEYSVCGHWVKNIDSSNNFIEKKICTGEKCPESFTTKDAIPSTPIHPGSWMIRSSSLEILHLPNIINTFIDIPAGDDPLMLLILTRGKGFCIQEYMGVYRIHSAGTWTSSDNIKKHLDMMIYYCSIKLLVEEDFAICPTLIKARINLIAYEMAGRFNRESFDDLHRNLLTYNVIPSNVFREILLKAIIIKMFGRENAKRLYNAFHT